jgi:putative nucleotidyltransferase with HDIG domain
MEREEALSLIQEKIQNQNLIKHCLAAEVCMIGLAEHFNEDKEKWGLTGLLHDIDYEETKNDPNKHSIIGAEMLEKAGLEKDIVDAVKTHNEAHGIAPESRMAKAIFTIDPLTGLIVAATLVLPSKKIADLTAENVINRFGEKSFAKGANRKIISQCQELLDIDLKEFIEIGLKAMQSTAEELGL